jgi:enolase
LASRDIITKVHAREILDSRGNPTVEAIIHTETAIGTASVPSGKSRGKYECVELRDNDDKRYMGMGVKKAVWNINQVIAKEIIGMRASDYKSIDRKMIELDGTANKSRLGGNAILAVSIACLKAASHSLGKPLFSVLNDSRKYSLPVPMMNLINGGEHAGNRLSVQEFLVIPVGAKTFSESLMYGAEIYHTLKKRLIGRYGKSAVNVGDEGGFAPPLERTDEALDILVSAIEERGYEDLVWVGLDIASNTFYSTKERKYNIDGLKLGTEEMIEFLKNIQSKYNLRTLEDPLNEDDFEGFAELRKELKGRALVIGDDLLCTNIQRIKRALQEESVDVALIKPNQIGTVMETVNAINLAHSNNILTVVSHRSGETEDTFIAHLACSLGSAIIKSGAPARGERTAKYNELLRIEEMLGKKAYFEGRMLRRRGWDSNPRGPYEPQA